MRVEGKTIVLKAEEVSSECPIKPRWAAGMVGAYGPDHAFKGQLARFARCPEVLKLAGYEVEIEEPASVEE